MEEIVSEDLQYPVGNLKFVDSTPALRRQWIGQYRDAPGFLHAAVEGLSVEQLQSTYRPGGWTIAQVVHHLAEMDASSYTRLKFALTETIPTVAAAQQALWAEIADSKSTNIASSLALFEAVRIRWAEAWEAMHEKDFERQWKHPRLGIVTLDQLLQQYAWHARHHTAQITSHRQSMGW
jgi:uncharacterized damage-inducible protein DinB